MTLDAAEAAQRFGPDFNWTPYQLDCFRYWMSLPDGKLRDRLCVYYPTGKGKTKTMLTCIALRGYKECLVIAPPTTESNPEKTGWRDSAEMLGIDITFMSHAKFRMKGTRVSRDIPVIADEFHMFGGHTGHGWKKLDRMAQGLKAPLIIGSATPNYNDAERCYCIAHVLDPWSNRGGYISWLYQNCQTEPNPYGMEPYVTGFLRHKDAEDFLSQLPGVVYLPDDAPDILTDVEIHTPLPDEFHEYGLDRSRSRIMASQMEERHRTRYLQIVDPYSNKVHQHVYDELDEVAGNTSTPLLVYADHSSIALALANSLILNNVRFGYVDGKTPPKVKAERIAAFKAGEMDVLVGTATLATGTDGIDKMCDAMVILDDTDDPSLRRQLVGRILPRGLNTNYADKFAHRFVYLS